MRESTAYGKLTLGLPSSYWAPAGTGLVCWAVLGSHASMQLSMGAWHVAWVPSCMCMT